MSSAEELKAQGNAKFAAGDWAAAEGLYTKALALDADNAALYSNRSICRLHAGQSQAALADAQRCVQLRPDWEKGHYRQGAALESLGDLAAALPAYQQALELNPMSEELLSKVKALKKQLPKDKQPKQAPGAGAIPKVQAASMGRGPPAPDGWAAGLTPAKQHEWLTDCYRMRVDDDAVYGGGDTHGLYDPDATGDTIAVDFLIFCKLAVKNRVVPAKWDWGKFLKAAVKLLPYAFEKSDAQEKWGGENVFAVAMGGRSLRFTGEVVYGTSIMGVTADKASAATHAALAQALGGRRWRQVTGAGGHFDDVGGVALWEPLAGKLSPQRYF